MNELDSYCQSHQCARTSTPTLEETNAYRKRSGCLLLDIGDCPGLARPCSGEPEGTSHAWPDARAGHDGPCYSRMHSRRGGSCRFACRCHAAVVPPFQAGFIFRDGPLAHEKIAEVGSTWRERQD